MPNINEHVLLLMEHVPTSRTRESPRAPVQHITINKQTKTRYIPCQSFNSNNKVTFKLFSFSGRRIIKYHEEIQLTATTPFTSNQTPHPQSETQFLQARYIRYRPGKYSPWRIIGIFSAQAAPINPKPISCMHRHSRGQDRLRVARAAHPQRKITITIRNEKKTSERMNGKEQCISTINSGLHGEYGVK